MSRRLIVVGFWMLLAGSQAWGQEWATKMFENAEHDFGNCARGAKAEHEFALSNIYMEEVHITGVRSSCGCTSVRVGTPTLRTYEKGAIIATFNTGLFLGQRGATLTVTLDKPYPAEVQLHVKGYIHGDVVFEPGSVQLGDVDPAVGAQRQVTVSYAGRSDWRILDVRGVDPHLSAGLVEISRTGGQVAYALAVRLNPGASVGYLNDQIMLVTNDPRTPQIPLTVEARVLGSVTVSPSSLFLGVVEPGERVTKPLVVKGKTPFRIVSISCADGSFEFGRESDPAPKLLHVIPVTFVAGPNSGKVVRTIRIETDLGKSPPELAAYAVIAKP
ncbi:MAG: DUF1573 domain-containing protein [Thermoguttaceae bacterium]|jgi:hypothetical protein